MARQMSDHCGNTFSSFVAMCKFYNMIEHTVRRRLREGWTLKEALTTSTHNQVCGIIEEVYDHNGYCYESKTAMCAHYGINVRTYSTRVNSAKMSVKDALTRPVNMQYHGKKCIDHLGNEYPSLLAMCRHYGIHRMKYKNRIKLGWSQEDALTKC